MSKADKDILLHLRAWLNDSIIHAAQVLLKNQVPVIGGLQEPGKGQMCSFDIERGEFVQILHDGHGHWLMVSTIGVKNDGEVHVYDSMYSSVRTYTKKQIASILCTEQSRIELHTMDVRMQAGVAYLQLHLQQLAIVNGVPPGKFIFDQVKMRQHLYQCLLSGKLQMFPTLRERRGVT